ncbi:MAG: DUF4364 family protein [Oscillospiraceae bacterium]|nr:DUF4364 family protein [Oscillospiraceae bacterium]
MAYTYDDYLTEDMLSLHDEMAVKILICYFLRQINRPITPTQLAEIATSDGIVNYFTYSSVVESMLESGMLTLRQDGDEEYYVLSEAARAGADSFKQQVPQRFRNKILSAGLKFFARLKNENDVKISISEQDKGYLVGVTCTDMGIVLMDLKIYAPDEEQAKLLADKIRLNPTDFYAKVIDFATENEEYQPEVKEVDDL